MKKINRLNKQIAFIGSLFMLFTAQRFFPQNVPDGNDFTIPFNKCWEYKNAGIERFASDNKRILTSSSFQDIYNNENNKSIDSNNKSIDSNKKNAADFILGSDLKGDVTQISSSEGLQNWTISVGEKSSNTPFIFDRDVFIVSKEISERSGEKNLAVKKIDPATGITVWTENFYVGGEYHLLQTAQRLILIIDNLQIYSINKINGKIIDKLNLEGVSEQIIKKDNGQIYILTTDKNLFKINPETGKLKEYRQKKIDLNGSITASNFAEANKFATERILLGTDSGYVLSLDENLKQTKTLFRAGGKINDIIISEKDFIVTSNDNFLYYYSAEKGKIIWKKRLSGRIVLEPKISEGHIFASTVNQFDITIFRISDGKIVNHINFGKDSFIKDFQINNNALYVLNNDGLTKYKNSGCFLK